MNLNRRQFITGSAAATGAAAAGIEVNASEEKRVGGLGADGLTGNPLYSRSAVTFHRNDRLDRLPISEDIRQDVWDRAAEICRRDVHASVEHRGEMTIVFMGRDHMHEALKDVIAVRGTEEQRMLALLNKGGTNDSAEDASDTVRPYIGGLGEDNLEGEPRVDLGHVFIRWKDEDLDDDWVSYELRKHITRRSVEIGRRDPNATVEIRNFGESHGGPAEYLYVTHEHLDLAIRDVLAALPDERDRLLSTSINRDA